MKSAESILICCAGLGMGNASRVVALMEALRTRGQESGREFNFHILSWGAGLRFLERFREESGFAFELQAIASYPSLSWNSLPQMACLYWKNTRRVRSEVARLRPSLLILDSDYHFAAYLRSSCPVVSVGQAADVVLRAKRLNHRCASWREFLNFGCREKLDAIVQRICSKAVLIPSFDPSAHQGSATKQKAIPLIVRREFLENRLSPRGDSPAPLSVHRTHLRVGLLLSGSELEKKPFVDFARRHGLQVLSPGARGATVPSQASALDGFDVVLTQGGLSSISECLARGKFMVVFPLADHPEQILNAHEVECRGWGIRGALSDLRDYAELAKKIERARKSVVVEDSVCNGADEAAQWLLRLMPQPVPVQSPRRRTVPSKHVCQPPVPLLRRGGQHLPRA